MFSSPGGFFWVFIHLSPCFLHDKSYPMIFLWRINNNKKHNKSFIKTQRKRFNQFPFLLIPDTLKKYMAIQLKSTNSNLKPIPDRKYSEAPPFPPNFDRRNLLAPIPETRPNYLYRINSAKVLLFTRTGLRDCFNRRGGSN